MKERPDVSFFNACNSLLRTVKYEKTTLLSPLQMTELEEEEGFIDTEEESEDEENLIDRKEISKLLENYVPSHGDGYTWLPKGHYKLDGDETWQPILNTAKIEDGKITSIEVYWIPATAGTQVMFDKQVRRKID